MHNTHMTMADGQMNDDGAQHTNSDPHGFGNPRWVDAEGMPGEG